MLAPLPTAFRNIETITTTFPPERDDGDGQHWHVLTDAVTVATPSANARSVQAVLIPLDAHWARRIDAARRLQSLLAGTTPPRLVQNTTAKRISNALRVHDGREERASYRDLGIALFGESRINEEPWKTSPLKAQIARLSRYASLMLQSGYRSILQGHQRPRG